MLNKTNKVIKNLKGNKIKEISSENALIYFYKKINSEISSINFDKSKKGKIMKFNITSNITQSDEKHKRIYIAKDFGFEGYYPMTSKESWEVYKYSNGTATVYIENWYDKLKNELYEDEDEKYIIYTTDSIYYEI